MTSIKNKIEALENIKKRITEQRDTLKNMCKEETAIIKEIKNYLNQTGEEGIRIDPNTVITVINHDKKIQWNKKEYQERVKNLLYDRGINDEKFLEELLDKTHNVVQQQKLKIVKK